MEEHAGSDESRGHDEECGEGEAVEGAALPGAGWPPRVTLSTGHLLSDDEGVGIGVVAAVASVPVACVAEVESMARSGLAGGDDVLLVWAQGHQLVGGDDALAHQGGVG